MFIDVTTTAVRSEHRRQMLLDEARQYRLAALAKAARRAGRHADDQGVEQIAAADPEPPDDPAQVSAFAAGKAGANCR